jgi:predicted nucleic acid-binding protein
MVFWNHELRVAGRELKLQIKLALHARKFQQERLIAKAKFDYLHATAVKNGTIRILSEDLNAGQRIAGILIENPFVGTR